MGVLPAVNLSNLVALDVGGLTQALQLIMESVQDQQEIVETVRDQVAEQKQRLDTMEDAFGSGNDGDDEAQPPTESAAPQVLGSTVDMEAGDTSAPGSRRPSVGYHGTVGEASRAGHGGHRMSAMNIMNTALSSVQALEASVEALAKRLALSEQHQGEWAQAEQARQAGCAQLEKRLDEERQHGQSLEHSVRAIEDSLRLTEAKFADGSRDLEELRSTLTDEFRRSYQQFEARVRVSEEKASACRQEAKEFRGTEDTREYAISEVQSQIRKVSTTSKHALQNSGQAVEAQKDTSNLSECFEAQFQELEGRLQAKASESIVEAIRSDFEMNSKVMHDAVKAVGQKLSEQEERLKGLECTPLRRTLMQDSVATESRSVHGLPPTWDTNEKVQGAGDDATRCLLCRNDRSVSPTRNIMGTDNHVYAHIAPATPDGSTQLGEPQLLSTIRASPNALQNFVRPRPTPASIPRPQSAPHLRLHHEVERAAGTTAVAVSSKKVERRPGRDVKSSRLSDLLAVESRSLTSSKTLSRPTSAQQRPARPSSAQAVRPSSAGATAAGTVSLAVTVDSSSVAAALESQEMLLSQSLPAQERRLDGTVIPDTS